MSQKHKLKARWLVQSMRPHRVVYLTHSAHTTENAGRRGLRSAVSKYPLNTWRLVKEEEVMWWPR